MTLGIAMIARNAARTMGRALGPFRDIADEVAIVFGGKSDDDTELTARFFKEQVGCPVRLAHYDGKLDGDGRLMDFGAARQQATDLLDTDWMLVVDADDVWYGAEHLLALIDDAEEHSISVMQFPYTCGRGTLAQTRLMRRDSGRWRGPVHEYWDINAGVKVAKTERVWLEQDKPDEQARPGHNIAIAEAHLEAHNDTECTRVLFHLGQDYLSAGRSKDALAALDRYLGVTGGENREELYEAHYCRSLALIDLGEYAQAAASAVGALSVWGHVHGFVALAEAALLMGEREQSSPLCRLAVACADLALETGQVRTGRWTGTEMTAAVPLRLKGRALAHLGQRQAAHAALDIARQLVDEEPEDTELREGLSQRLGI